MSNTPTATIEIGHVYLDRPQLDEVEIARLNAFVGDIGKTATRVAFVDDVKMRPMFAKATEEARDSGVGGQEYVDLPSVRLQMSLTMREQRAKDAAESMGIDRGNVFFERTFEPTARKLLAEIQSMALPEGYRLSQDGTRLRFGSGKNRRDIPLQGYKGVEDLTFPSCEMLDLSWLMKRLEMAPKAITVLPRTDFYEREQANIAALAELFGVPDTAHETIFYDK